MKTRIVQILIVSVPIVLFFWLLCVDIAPSGVKTVVYLAGEDSPYINHLLPNDRVEYFNKGDKDEVFVRIKDEPVYLSVDLPHTEFDSVEVEVEFKNNNQPIFELGAMVDVFADGYDLRPIQNLLIEDSDWQDVGYENIVFLDRTGEESSVHDFLDSPDRYKLATYHFELNDPYIESNYKPTGAIRTTFMSLRGHHQYLTYVGDEEFYLKVFYTDMNRTLGRDDVAVRVYDASGGLVTEFRRGDDQNTTDNQERSMNDIDITLNDLPVGVYKVELSGTSDIFWRALTSTQRYMSFVDRVYLGDSVGYLDGIQSATLYTNAKNLFFETAHVEGVQTIELAGDLVDIYTTHEKIDHSVATPGVALMSVPSNDIKITGAGKYAFSRDAFFEPDPVKLTYNTDLDTLGVDYILAAYSYPIETDGWLKNQTGMTEFRLDNIRQEDNTAKFILSVPGIDEGGSIDVHKITLTFHKDSMTFWEFLGAIRERMPFGI